MIILDLGKVDGKHMELVHDGLVPPLVYSLQEFIGSVNMWQMKPEDPTPMVREVFFDLQAIEGPTTKSPAVAFYRRRPDKSIWRSGGRPFGP